nr:serine/threonine-protein kinase [Kofleriaceae bacterium]
MTSSSDGGSSESPESPGTAATAPDPRHHAPVGDDELVLPPPSYRLGEPLGQGGMGEVLRARDQRIGRDVAFKRMRVPDPQPADTARFLREARIQARLGHPAIAPVYDIGHDGDGRPYFTMRAIAGDTLDTLVRGDAPARRLLRAFADVCLAVQYAHEQGVVHRDLKPANIMLGDYGEVYILDWGVARVVDAADRPSTADIGSLAGHTQAGALLGTPGYMAPEQARGDVVGPAADVYSLGAILYELLTREPLHPRDVAIASTLSEPTRSPAARDAEHAVPPELDAACVAALAAGAATRPSARELADRVQRYLDGDRDLERRRTIAAEQLAHARAVVATGGPERRAEAIRTAGRALALDPESPDAAALVGTLMLEPPRELPPALVTELAAHDVDLGARSSRYAAVALCSYFLFFPLLLLDGVKSWPYVIVAYALVAGQIVLAEWMYRARRPSLMPVLVMTIALMIPMSRLWGPLVLIPGIINTVAFTAGAQPNALARPIALSIGSALALAVPMALEWLGVLAPTWSVGDGRITIVSPGVELDNAWASVLLVTANLALIFVNCVFARSVSLSRHEAQRSLAIQAWRLRQLLPT